MPPSNDDPGRQTQSKIGRRRFMHGLAALTSTAAVTNAVGAQAKSAARPRREPFTVVDQTPWAKQTRRLKITRGRTPVSSFIFPTDYPTHFRLKPELHHVCTPRGIEVTGSHEYCFIHHMSISCGHGKVQVDGDKRIVDFYRHLPFPDLQRRDPHRPPDTTNNLFQIGPSGMQKVTRARWRGGDRVVIGLQLAWQTREQGKEDGDVLALEERFYSISRVADATVVDMFSKLMPATHPLTLIPESDHGYMAVRVHDFIDADDGGTMRDSEGRVPSGHFRFNSDKWVAKAGSPRPTKVGVSGGESRPRWVDCTGTMGDATVGMTLISHPANPKNEWYAREFGLIIVSAAQTVPLRITHDKPFEFGARYAAHDGPLVPQATNELHTAFGRLNAEECRQYLEG